MQLVLHLPMPLNIANPRELGVHWAKRYKAKRAYYKRCDEWVMLKRAPPAPETPLAPPVSIISTMVLHEAMDGDNAGARHKWTVDWLRERGYIVDDKHRLLLWASLPEQRIDRKLIEHLVITLENDQ